MNRNLKIIFGVLGLLVVALILWYFSSLVIYIVISAILSILGAPLVRRLKKIKVGYTYISASIAAAITLFLYIAAIFIVLSIFSPLVAEEAEIISKISSTESGSDLANKLTAEDSFLSRINLSGDEQSNQEYLNEKLLELINFDKISNIFDNVIGVLGNVFVAVFSIFFMTFFFLKDGYLLQKIIYSLTPDRHIEKIKKIESRSHKLMSQYLIGVLIQLVINIVVITSGLMIIGVEHALIIGLLGGIMNLIPYIGPIIGGIIGVLVAMSSNIDTLENSELLLLIGKVLGVFLVAQAVDNLFTQPFVIGKSVKAHPLEVFIVISAAGTLAGIGGMIVAVPLYTIMKIVASEFFSRFKAVDNLTRSISQDE